MTPDSLHLWAVYRSLGDHPADVLSRWHSAEPLDLAHELHRYYALAPVGNRPQYPGEPTVRIGSHGSAQLWISWTDPNPEDNGPPTLRGQQIAEIIEHLLTADDPPDLPSRDAAPLHPAAAAKPPAPPPIPLKAPQRPAAAKPAALPPRTKAKPAPAATQFSLF